MAPDPIPAVSERFQVQGDRLGDGTQRLRIYQVPAPGRLLVVTWQQAIALWQHDPAFRQVLTQALASLPFAAFFWETPPITPRTLDHPWECVAVVAPALATVSPDPSPFGRHLTGGQAGAIATFPNLGGDALLVVPRPQGPVQAYPHLAQFLRTGSSSQVHALWQTLGATVQRHLIGRGDRPLWVSTSGLGVYWLHIRLDDGPKYYTHRPYRQEP